jgi:mRNA interferase RelE/StbE
MPWYRLACKPAVIADLAALDKELAQRLFDKTKWLASNVGNLRHELIDRTDNILDVHGIIHRKALA